VVDTCFCGAVGGGDGGCVVGGRSVAVTGGVGAGDGVAPAGASFESDPPPTETVTQQKHFCDPPAPHCAPPVGGGGSKIYL